MTKSRRSGGVSRADSATVRLREMIVAGQIPAGLHLQEIPLAEKLGISRTPVRAALRTLAQEGLLVPGPRRGYKTRSFSFEELQASYVVRGCLEGLACGLLARSGLTEDVRGQLLDCLAFGDRALTKGKFGEKDQESWATMNERFHRTIVTASRNELLISLVHVTQRLPMTGAGHVHWYKLDQRNFFRAMQAHAHHHAIVEAMLERDSGRAEAAMREHIRYSADLLAEFQRELGKTHEASASVPLAEQRHGFAFVA
jgi:GntR family transcriptional regulator of vanillate catabolism